jgi:hypothetical protein
MSIAVAIVLNVTPVTPDQPILETFFDYRPQILLPFQLVSGMMQEQTKMRFPHRPRNLSTL